MNQIRSIASNIQKGQNLLENLEKYKDIATPLYHEYSYLELAFSAYLLREEMQEEKKRFTELEKDTLECVWRNIHRISSRDARQSMIDEMSQLRDTITKKMDALTAYADQLVCYEYVLNRKEYAFLSQEEVEQKKKEFDDEVFVQKLSLFMFSSKDQMVIQQNVRSVISQLPVRMTKNKFFEKLENGISLYEGSEQSALSQFLYMLRTTSMVYEVECKSDYPIFEKLVKELSEVKYNDLTKDSYDALVEKLQKGANEVRELTDFYYSLQTVVNRIYSVALLNAYDEDSSEVVSKCQAVLSSIEIEKMDEDLLVPLEGEIERYVTKTGHMEAILPEVLSLKEQFGNHVGFFDDFVQVTKLLSDSVFIDLTPAEQTMIATSEDVKKESDRFIKDLSDKMQTLDKAVCRGIMAQVLHELPVFLRNSQEILDYIQMTLIDCSDPREKLVTMDLLQQLMDEQ